MDKIVGKLSPIDTMDESDKGHRARLLHFYKKHGFEIHLKDKGDGIVTYQLNHFV